MAATTLKSGNAADQYQFGPWHIVCERSHILPSQCAAPKVCNTEIKCNFCKYESELDLPKLPDMTFAGNFLSITHTDGYGIKFNCFDALKEADNPKKIMKVAIAEAWSESRDESQHLKDVIKPFDWTFTTSYKGTMFGEKTFEILPTTEKIDVEKLKVKEEILFYEDNCLFEDELADNGIAQMSVKIRVMKSGFFVLLRYFLRVDNLLARIYDTRIYHEAGKDFMLREYCKRENKLSELQVSNAVLINPAELSQHLELKDIETHILKMPESR